MSRPTAHVVTGGGRGIGAATAVHLARQGHDVVVSHLRRRRGGRRGRRGGGGGRRAGLAVRGDVADDADVDRLFDEAAGLGR